MADISIVRKTTNSFPVTFTNNGAVQDITGWTVFFTVKRVLSSSDSEAIISKTITSHTNPSGGVTTITLSDDDTDISDGVYYWDITYIDSSSNRQSTVPGSFIVIENVTKRES